MAWTPPGFTVKQVRNVYSAGTVSAHFGGDVPNTRGLVLHVQDGNGGLFGWFDNPKSLASSAWWAGKNGEREQYGDPDTERFWTQAAGNWDWHAVECEGRPDEPMTAAQVETVAQILAAGHERYGWPLQLTDDPDGAGLGWHGMGAPAWGHAYCPGEIRKAQMPAIVARAKEIAGEKETVAVSANGWPVFTTNPGPTFTAPTGDTPDVASDDLAALFADLAYSLHTEVAHITKAWGGRTWAQQMDTNPAITTSNHLSFTACDMPLQGINGYGARTSGLTWAQEQQIDRILARITTARGERIFEWGNDFITPSGSTAYRDPVHWQVRQKYPYGAGPYVRVVSEHNVATAATKIRRKWQRIQTALSCPADGIAGPSTLAAVEAFQKAHGLVVDGIVGPATERALFPPAPERQPARPSRDTACKSVKAEAKPAHERLTVDGVAGRSTVKELQRQLGTRRDGTISSQPRRYRNDLRSWTTVKFAHGKATGSSVVKALQHKVGAHADGIFGPGTAKELQHWLRKHGGAGIDVDGIPGDRTVKALQRALNREDLK